MSKVDSRYVDGMHVFAHTQELERKKRPKTALNVNNLHKWTKDHQYRTNYTGLNSNHPKEPISSVLPGYTGYIPGKNTDNHYGQCFYKTAIDCFNDPKISNNRQRPAKGKIDHIDHSLTAGGGIQKPHPAWDHKGPKIPTSHLFHQDPKSQLNPTFRKTEKHLQTTKKETMTSGFQQNHAYFDGTGWVTEEPLHTDMKRTEYRIHYCADIPKTRQKQKCCPRKLKQKEKNYKHT